MVEHSAIADAERHEPKGASTATSGQVYVSDGAASGDWKELTANYASIYNRDSDAVTISTIGTTASGVPFSNDGEDNLSTADSANNRITVSSAGVYFVTFTISFETSAVGDAGEYEFRIVAGGTDSILECFADMSGTSDLTTVSTSGLLLLSASDTLTVEVYSDNGSDTDDIVIRNCNLSVVLAKET